MATYSTIHTRHGLMRMAAAEASGVTINLTHMAVGDGNGSPVSPIDTQPALVRERFRAPVNRVYKDPSNPLLHIAELVVPASVGGFTQREVGLFDADGALFVVGNLPATYKPTDAEGAFSDTIVRVQFLVSNANVVSLRIDPNVAVVTQNWIANNVTAGAMIPGGTTGQVLKKRSNADGDTEWDDLEGFSVTVDCIEETQTLAADQVQVDLVVTTTRGLALYVDTDNNGSAKRLRRDQWRPDLEISSRLFLTHGYPAGTRLIATQNEPSGNAPAPLERSKNLADVEDKAAARANLGVYSKDETASRGKQPGDIFYTARDTAPARSLKANGAAVSRTAFAELFAAIGTRFGGGDGFTTFNVPDLRGEFIRGWDDSRGVDSGRALGSSQTSQNLAHNHQGNTETSGDHSHPVEDPGHGHDIDTAIGNGVIGLININGGGSQSQRSRTSQTGISLRNAGAHAHVVNVLNSGGTEARPRNVAMLACIAY